MQLNLLVIFLQNFLKQPKVLGELCAGMLIGPYVLGAIPLGELGAFISISSWFNYTCITSVIWYIYLRFNFFYFLIQV